MKVFQSEIEFETKKLYEFKNLTEEVRNIVKDSNIKNGIAFIYSFHNTSSLLIQEDDEDVKKDLIEFFNNILPLDKKYHHSYEGNINATAHIKNSLLSSCIFVPIKNKDLSLGRWQSIFFIELFEPLKRKVLITIIGD